MDWGGAGARGLIAGGLVLGKQQLRRRGFCAETAILARGSDGQRRGGRRGAVWVLHPCCAEWVGQSMAAMCM